MTEKFKPPFLTSCYRKESAWWYFQYGELQVSHDIWQKLSLLLLTGIQKESKEETRDPFLNPVCVLSLNFTPSA